MIIIPKAASHYHTIHVEDEADIIEVLHEGSITLWRTGTTLDLLIVHHTEFDCVELCAYNPAVNMEAPRVYVRASSLFTRMDIEVFQCMVDEKKEFLTKRHLHFSLQSIERSIHYEFAANYLISHVTVDRPKAIFFHVQLAPQFGDTLHAADGVFMAGQLEDGSHLDLLMSKPIDLIPVTSIHHAQPLLRASLFTRGLSEVKQGEREKLMTLIAMIGFPHTTSKQQRQLHRMQLLSSNADDQTTKMMSLPRLRRIWAIRRVLRVLLCEKFRQRLLLKAAAVAARNKQPSLVRGAAGRLRQEEHTAVSKSGSTSSLSSPPLSTSSASASALPPIVSRPSFCSCPSPRVTIFSASTTTTGNVAATTPSRTNSSHRPFSSQHPLHLLPTSSPSPSARPSSSSSSTTSSCVSSVAASAVRARLLPCIATTASDTHYSIASLSFATSYADITSHHGALHSKVAASPSLSSSSAQDISCSNKPSSLLLPPTTAATAATIMTSARRSTAVVIVGGEDRDATAYHRLKLNVNAIKEEIAAQQPSSSGYLSPTFSHLLQHKQLDRLIIAS